MVAEAFEHRRCLVLVDGFYVWQPAHGAAANGEPGGIEPADDEATGGESADDEPPDDDAADAETIRPYRVTTRDEEPFAVAGVWEVWAARGSSHLSVGLVTTDADAAVRDVTDEMPVVLDEPGRERWLDAADADEVRDLLAGGSTPDLGIAPVSRAVTDPTNDGPDVARTVDVSRQVGLDAFAGPEK